ncbi:MAG: RNA methyltransferase [Lentisphaeria bacterium]|jgi:TrmH family RNA methyltransferase
MTRAQRTLALQAHDRHGRRKHGVFLVEGLRCTREALARHPQALRLAIASQSFADSADAAALQALLPPGHSLELLADPEFAKLAATDTPQGILCLFQTLPEPPPATTPPRPCLLVLDRLQEPGNLGTILRTAWAAGLHEAWLTAGTTDPFGPKAIRAGMGAQFALALREVADLATAKAELLRRGGRRLWAAVPAGGVNCFSPGYDPAGNALVIGNEANGIRPEDLTLMDRVTIPMPGNAESLNAAQAATILLFEGVRRGLAGGG